VSGRAFVGTSGWSYASWRPKFYPEGTKSATFLRYYATRLRTIEINYTFNHLPTEKNVAEWTAATPEDFVFGLKASQQITHRMQLREPAETLPIFFERARLLGHRLGPILFQTPPWVKRDYDLLRTANVALVHAEGEKAPSPVETLGVTADFGYARLRNAGGYPDDAVDAWAARLGALLDSGKDVYAYFRHDEDGSNALSAERLRRASS
jgi:uncharacterized protein YecE (DUF72 family)